MTYFSSIKKKVTRLIAAATRDTPDRIAMAVAMGLVVGLTPTMGVQIATILVVATIPKLHFNIPIACVVLHISNPFTVIPLYYAMYWLGIKLLGRSVIDFADFKANIGELMQSIREGDNLLESLWLGVSGIFDIGINIAIPMWIGGVVLGITTSIPAFFIVRWCLQRSQQQTT